MRVHLPGTFFVGPGQKKQTRRPAGLTTRPRKQRATHQPTNPSTHPPTNPPGEYIKTWRRRWFVLKSGKILWFKTDADALRPDSQPRGVVDVRRCLSIKGAEDAINRPCAFEVSTSDGESMFFVADTDKDKEDWINAVGRAIVRHSRALLEHDVQDYTTAAAAAAGGGGGAGGG